MKLNASLILLFCATTAFAQTKSQPAATTAGSPGRAAPPPPPSSAEELAKRLRANENSLFRASQPGASVNPGSNEQPQTQFEQASFFAVATPQPRVIKKHDLVTVVVREQSQFKSEGSSELKKDAKLEAAVTDFVRLSLNNLQIIPSDSADKKISLGGKREFKGEGSIDRTDNFTARVQAEVIDIKPNGTLVLQARKKIQTDDESQTFLLAGIVRAEDVTPDNTVLSSQMYDFDIRRTSTGTVRQATRRGWLPRLLDAINPF